MYIKKEKKLCSTQDIYIVTMKKFSVYGVLFQSWSCHRWQSWCITTDPMRLCWSCHHGCFMPVSCVCVPQDQWWIPFATGTDSPLGGFLLLFMESGWVNNHRLVFMHPVFFSSVCGFLYEGNWDARGKQSILVQSCWGGTSNDVLLPASKETVQPHTSHRHRHHYSL